MIWLKGLFPFLDRIAIPCFMVISGFVYAKSMMNETIKEACRHKVIIKRLKRYLLPYTCAYILEIAVFLLAALINSHTEIINSLGYSLETDPNNKISFSYILKGFLTGGFGPGSYYTPVMIQLVFLFPLLYLFIEKYRYKGLVASGIFCFFSELWQYYFQIPHSVYRLLILRHVMTICFGIYLALGCYKRNKLLNALSMLVGFTYIVAHSYFSWTPAFFNNG